MERIHSFTLRSSHRVRHLSSSKKIKNLEKIIHSIHILYIYRERKKMDKFTIPYNGALFVYLLVLSTRTNILQVQTMKKVMFI